MVKSSGDLKWADYTTRNELLLNDVLAGRCEVVGHAYDGDWEFGWVSVPATPLQPSLFDDIAGLWWLAIEIVLAPSRADPSTDAGLRVTSLLRSNREPADQESF
jgi:hypothetical protein